MKTIKVEKDVWKKLRMLKVRQEKSKISDVIRGLLEGEPPGEELLEGELESDGEEELIF